MSVRGEASTVPLSAQESVVEQRFRQWLELRDQKARLEELRADLMDRIAAMGSEDAGSQFLELSTPVEYNGKHYKQLKRERRSKTLLSEDRTRGLLAAKDSSLVDRVFKQVLTTEFDTEALYDLLEEGVITSEELDGLMETTYQYAFQPLAE